MSTLKVETPDGDVILEVGLSRDVIAKKKKDSIRLVKLIDDIPKEFWYDKLKGNIIQVYLFKGYSDALSVTFPDVGAISHEHFDLVKYYNKDRNSDVRLK